MSDTNLIRFFVVVPTMNSSEYIEACLASLTLVQPGAFGLHIHVQDGGSTDTTLELVDRWRDRNVTVRSEPDAGIYDAISRGAEHLQDDDIMTWLGSDDLMMPGALATVASIFSQLDEVQWLTGRHHLSNARGEGYNQEPVHYLHRDLAEGKHDGRTREFIMQEGTFWRASLWRRAGGLDRSLRFAGDWDLWRRFAAMTPLYAVDIPLARFTRRAGQTSEDMEAYYAEVDALSSARSEAPLLSYDLKRYPWDEQWEIVHAIDRRSDEWLPGKKSSLGLREVAARLFSTGENVR